MVAKAWIAGGSGVWSGSGNWSPGGFPSAIDDVTINGSATTFQAISGPGFSASMVFLGSTLLSGPFGTGALTVGSDTKQGALALAAGTVLAASSATVLFGPLQVSGGSTRMMVTGALTLGGPRASTSLFPNTVSIESGAKVQAGSVVLAASPGGNGISVDSLSSLAIGGASGAAPGRITVDEGRALSGVGVVTASGGVLNQGTILAQGGALAIGGGVTGTGQLQIGAGATLYVYNGISSQGVTFTGPGGTLEVTSAGAGLLTSTGVISGFAPGQSIWFASGIPLTGVTYQAGANGLGSLTLSNGSMTLGSLTLSGSYTGASFQVTPSRSYGATITVAQANPNPVPNPPPAPPPGGGSAASDSYAWTGSGGAWSNPGNWRDTTAGTAAAGAPGSGNAVTLVGPAGTAAQTVMGPGSSASLLVLGNSSLGGAFTTGALSVGSASAAGSLALSGGSSLAAQSATLVFGPLQLTGTATRLTVAGQLMLGGARSSQASFAANTLSLMGGAAAQAGSVVLAPASGGNGIVVDSGSSLEVGLAGAAAPGTITVDPGRTLSGAGSLQASGGVLNQGTILAEGGTLEIGGALSGAGQLQIGTGATLYIYNDVSSQDVSFTGTGGTLELTLTKSGELTEAGVVSGFAPGNTIYFASGIPLTGAEYRAGAGGAGTLVLNGAGGPLGTLSLAGNYLGYTFVVSPHGGYGTDIAVAPRFAPSPDPLFNAAFYLAANPDVAAAGVDPYQHFMNSGWREGRDPNALFHTSYYMNQNPDIAAAGVNPLLHFEASGWREGRDPGLGFSVRAYLSANPDVKNAGMNPLLHYITSGRAEGRAAPPATPHAVGNPDPGVDYAWYYAQHPDVAAAGLDASANYHASGVKLGYNPDPYFDTNFYLTQNPDVKAAGVDPLGHYEAAGWREGRAPSLMFSGADYLAANPDVRAAGANPLLHYLSNGRAEGRIGFMTGADTPPDPLVDTAYYDAQLGATLIPPGAAGQAQATANFNASGWQRGLNPDALFDTRYYLSRNPDVAAAGVNPLLHYEQSGWREGRDPSPQFSTTKYLAAYADVKAAAVDPLLHYVLSGQGEGRSAFSV